MYSITMLSLYFSFYSSLSPSLTVFLPLIVSLSLFPFLSLSLLPPLSFALKTVRILLSCCLDLTPDLFPRKPHPVVFFPVRRYRR